jgi:hypothetical protein
MANKLRITLLVFALLALSTVTSMAQNYKMVKNVVSSGAMIMAKSGTEYTMSGNFGQTIVSKVSSEGLYTPTQKIYQGFWAPIFPTSGVENEPDFSQYNVINYPNPFSYSTTVSFNLPVSAKVVIRIYSVSGNLVKTLFDGYQDAGEVNLAWDAKSDAGADLSSGTYLYEVSAQPASYVSNSSFEGFTVRNIMVIAK